MERKAPHLDTAGCRCLSLRYPTTEREGQLRGFEGRKRGRKARWEKVGREEGMEGGREGWREEEMEGWRERGREGHHIL